MILGPKPPPMKGAIPYDNEIIYQDFAPLIYDSGDGEPRRGRRLGSTGQPTHGLGHDPGAHSDP